MGVTFTSMFEGRQSRGRGFRQNESSQKMFYLKMAKEFIRNIVRLAYRWEQQDSGKGKKTHAEGHAEKEGDVRAG